MLFEVSESSSDIFSGEPAFLHLDFEDFTPMYMDRDPENSSRFFLFRMCPPNRKVTFFFSDPCKGALYTSKDYPTKEFAIIEGMNLKIERTVPPPPLPHHRHAHKHKGTTVDDK